MSEEKTYKCHFTNKDGFSQFGELALIDAESEEAAAKLFSRGKTGFDTNYILVTWGDGKSKIFYNTFCEVDNAITKKVNLTTDELLQKIVDNQNKQTEVLNRVHWEQNEQTGTLNKIRWAIIALLIFIVGQWIALKMKWGL